MQLKEIVQRDIRSFICDRPCSVHTSSVKHLRCPPPHTSNLSRIPRIYPCKFFLAGVNFYRFNAKNWHFDRFYVKKWLFFTDLTRKICVFGVNFILQRFCSCKKNDKYKVCLLFWKLYIIFFFFKLQHNFPLFFKSYIPVQSPGEGAAWCLSRWTCATLGPPGEALG